MAAFSEMTVRQLLDALASPNPTPGGGTASAIVGAMGTSLLIMVTGLAKSRNNTDEEKTALATARDALTPLTTHLTELADADTQAFDRVMAAYRLPKNSDEEKSARTHAIQTALQGATTVPLNTLRACADALRHARTVAEFGNRSAASDAGVAVSLLKAAAAGAHANVQINLDGIKDEGFKTTTAREAGRLTSAAVAAAAAAMEQLT
ncbi:MAG TPA: cyclodeaminase/cyclohydrolase family protein [Vicinamibacterales bacterium]